MTFIEALGSQPLTSQELRRSSPSANFMTGLILQTISLNGIFRSLEQYSETLGLRYNVFFGEARIGSISRNSISWELLLGTAEATYWRYTRIRTSMRWYLEALQLAEEISGEAAVGNSAAVKTGFDITHFDSFLLLQSEKQEGLLPIVAAAAHLREDPNEKRTSALFSRPVFY